MLHMKLLLISLVVIAADSATSSRELLYSACTRYLLKAISSVLVAEDPILLDVLSQRMRLKIMSNELSETAKANYLEAFLDLNTQKTIASSGAGIRSQGEVSCFLALIAVVKTLDDDSGCANCIRRDTRRKTGRTVLRRRLLHRPARNWTMHP